MIRRVPIFATVLVLAAVGVMIALGFWQLDRRAQKEAMLARYAAAQTLAAEVAWPLDPSQAEAALFRRTTIDCRVEGKDAPLAGYDRQGTVGWAHAVTCVLPGGARAEVVLGWAKDLTARQWPGGQVRGITVYDDFAHHPTAIRTTVNGLRRQVGQARILAIFEPRSNTMKLGTMKAQLPWSLEEADLAFCHSGGLGWDASAALAPMGARAQVADSIDGVITQVLQQVRPGDHLLCMSNGGFGGIHQRLLQALQTSA